MLAAVSGSQGTGKSTLLNALASDFPTITRKTSRSILTDWGVTLSQVNNDRELTVRFQEEILKRKIDDEAAAADDPSQWFFTERTYADLFVYALIAIGKDNEYSDWIDQYYQQCLAAMGTYKNVFYLSAGHFTPVNDGVRGANKHYSRMVDLTMLDYTKTMTAHYEPLVMADLSTRVLRVKSILREYQ